MPARGRRGRKSSLYQALYGTGTYGGRSRYVQQKRGRQRGLPAPSGTGASARAQWSKWRQTPRKKRDITKKLPDGTGGGTGYAPAPPPPGGGGTVTWEEFGYGVDRAPAAWKALKPSKLDERSQWFGTMNMLIPFLAPNQQVQIGQLLATEDPENFGHLAGMSVGSPGLDVATERREQFGGRRALMQAMEALSRFRGATGMGEDKMGAGYGYLMDLATRMADFSDAGAPRSRLDYMNMMSQLEPMIELAPESYRGIAQMMLKPGGWEPGKKMGTQYQWGTPHRELWG